MTTLSELGGSRELLVNLTLRELRGKYKRSALGWAWSLLNPLATMLIFSIVFRLFLKVPVPTGDPSGLRFFAFFLLCGLLPWNFLANGITGSMGALIGNANLIKKTYFPREILVGANVLSWVVSLLIELGVLAVALLVVGNVVLPWLPAVVVLVVLLTLFVTGLGLAFSVLNVYFRDVQHILGALLLPWFFLTPVFYTPDALPPGAEELRWLTVLLEWGNFVAPYVIIVRDTLFAGQWPSPAHLAYCTAVSAVSLVGGMWLFRRLSGEMAVEL